MKKKSIARFVCLVVLIFGIPSCQDDCGDLNGPVYYDVEVTGFEIPLAEEMVSDELLCSKTQGNTNGEGCFIPYRGGNFVDAKDSLLLYIRPSLAQKMAESKKMFPSGGFWFASAAYACSPVMIPKYNQRLQELYIRSNKDFNSQFPAGTNLVSLFSVLTEENEFISLPVKIQNDTAFFLQEDHRALKFNESPEREGAHVLTFEAILNDTSFVFKSDTLKLK